MANYLFSFVLFFSGGMVLWFWGTKIFSLQSRTLFGRETSYTGRTLESRLGRASVSKLPATLFFFGALVSLIGLVADWINQN